MGGEAAWDYAGSSLIAAQKPAAIAVTAGAGDLLLRKLLKTLTM